MGIVKCITAGKSDCKGDSYAKGGQVKCGTCGKMNCMAHGGKVDHEKGVHKPWADNERYQGESRAGIHAALVGTAYEKKDGDSKAISRKEHGDKLNELKQMPKPKLKGLAEGGEVEDALDMPGGDMDQDLDNELMEMAAEELVSAMEKKDKKGIVEAIKALVMSCKE